jgi:biopolymer transport protein ExbD
MKRFSQKSGFTSMAELNITPLLDLAFVLLVIFIITTPLMEQGINVSVPNSSPNRVNLDPNAVRTIQLDQAGKIYLDNSEIPLRQLEQELQKLHQAEPKLAVGIRADKSIAYEKVVEILDAVQRSGITQFGLITRVDENVR